MRSIAWTILALTVVGCTTGARWGGDKMAPETMVDARSIDRMDEASMAPLDDITNGLVADPGNRRGSAVFGRAAMTEANVDAPAPDTPRRERMLVYTGSVRVEVAQAAESAKLFLAKIESLGGYLQRQTGTSLTVRLPAREFDNAFEFARQAGRVLAESRQASDVTEEFVDLGIRIDNARKSRDRLLKILEIAEKVEDILKVETELRRLTEEIERMEGRIKFLRDQVAMATLRAEFQAAAAAPPPRRVKRPSRFRWVNRVGVGAVMEGF